MTSTFSASRLRRDEFRSASQYFRLVMRAELVRFSGSRGGNLWLLVAIILGLALGAGMILLTRFLGVEGEETVLGSPITQSWTGYGFYAIIAGIGLANRAAKENRDGTVATALILAPRRMTLFLARATVAALLFSSGALVVTSVLFGAGLLNAQLRDLAEFKWIMLAFIPKGVSI